MNRIIKKIIVFLVNWTSSLKNYLIIFLVANNNRKVINKKSPNKIENLKNKIYHNLINKTIIARRKVIVNNNDWL